MKKKYLKLISAALMMSMLFSQTAFASQATVEELKQKTEEAQQEVNAISGQKANAQAEVNSLQEDLTALLEVIDQLERDMIAKGEEIMKAEAELEEAKKREASQYAAMRLRIKFMYEEGNSTFLTILMSADDFADALNKAEYVSNISEYDRNMLVEYVETKEEVERLKAALEAQMAEMEALQAEYTAQQENLNNMIAQKQQEVADFDAQLNAAIVQLENAKKAQQEEEARVAAIEAARRAAEQEAARRAAAAASAQSTGSGEVYDSEGGGDDGGSDDGASYSSNIAPPAGASTIVAAAYGQIGVPYVWGGTSPGVGLDCSGLVQYCYRCAGIYIPRTSGAILASGTRVSNPVPGDICWTPGHVAIYIGGGQMIEAQQPGTTIKISPVRVSVYVRY